MLYRERLCAQNTPAWRKEQPSTRKKWRRAANGSYASSVDVRAKILLHLSQKKWTKAVVKFRLRRLEPRTGISRRRLRSILPQQVLLLLMLSGSRPSGFNTHVAAAAVIVVVIIVEKHFQEYFKCEGSFTCSGGLFGRFCTPTNGNLCLIPMADVQPADKPNFPIIGLDRCKCIVSVQASHPRFVL